MPEPSFLGLLASLAFFGAAAAWLFGAKAFFGIWRNRGEVSGLELGASFLTAVRKLPPEARPHLSLLTKAFAAFFAFVMLGMAAGIATQR